MGWVLDLCYLLGIMLAAPWLLYGAVRLGKYRDGYAEKLGGRVPIRPGNRPCVWFHAVSVGEVNLLQSLLDRFDATFPDWDCVISATTRTGHDLARRKYSGRTVFYCPLDFSWSVREAVHRIRPDLLVLAELELWPNLIRAVKRSDCRIAIVNGRLSERSYRGYRRLRWLFRPLLQQIDLIAAQNQEYAERFRALAGEGAATRICVTGSVKFDGVQTDCGHPACCRLRELAAISASDIVFLAGSTQEPEEELAIETYCQLVGQFPRLRLILAPRHITRCEEIADRLNRSGLHWQRRTSLETLGMDRAARILLVDTIGELAAWWGTSQIAFVGGSMGSRGGQNMIEPAAFGAAVSYGPNTSNFRDTAVRLLQTGGAVVVHDGPALTNFVRRCLAEPQWASELGCRAQQFVLSQQGAADRTICCLASLLARPEPNAHQKAA